MTARIFSPALCFGLTLTLVLGFGILTPVLNAADAPAIVGDWEGTLDPGAQPKQRVVVHITAAQDGTLSGTIDYPDQSVSGTQITAITFREMTLHFDSMPGQSIYDGVMSQDKTTIKGILKQAGANLNLLLKRTS